MNNPDMVTYLTVLALITLAYVAGYYHANRQYKVQAKEVNELLQDTFRILRRDAK